MVDDLSIVLSVMTVHMRTDVCHYNVCHYNLCHGSREYQDIIFQITMVRQYNQTILPEKDIQ